MSKLLQVAPLFRAARLPVLAAALLLVPLSGCGTTKFAYSPDELRALIAERAPEIPPDEVVIPFEVGPEHVARAKRIVQHCRTDTDRVEVLAEALFDPDEFGLVYEVGATATAVETLAARKGNCLSIASVFIGLARALGLRAYYLDFSHRINEVQQDRGILVQEGHMTAVIEANDVKKALDLDSRYRILSIHRFVDDVEAVAHFYNNRGYELILVAQERGTPVDWARVAHHFRLATRVRPDFARAWNNLGVARAKQDRDEEAMAAYREAIDLDDMFAAPHTNMGILLLAENRPEEALDAFRASAEIEGDNARIHYLTGLALYRCQKLDQAARALETAIDLQDDHAQALELLERIRREQQGLAGLPVTPASTLP